jgi:hypothetical protein
MKSLFVFLIMTSAVTVHAGNTKFSCSNVSGTAEWTIYVDLDKKLAGFFDNDTTVTVPLVNVLSLESNPPQTEYTFEGPDEYVGGKARIRIVFNETRLTGYVTLIDKRGKSKTARAEDGCEVDSDISL